MAGWILLYEIKYYECSKMLFDHEEAADKFLRGQLMEEDDICPDY